MPDFVVYRTVRSAFHCEAADHAEAIELSKEADEDDFEFVEEESLYAELSE